MMKKIFTRTGDSARQGRAKTIVNLNHEKGAYYRIPEALGLLKTLCIYMIAGCEELETSLGLMHAAAPSLAPSTTRWSHPRPLWRPA